MKSQSIGSNHRLIGWTPLLHPFLNSNLMDDGYGERKPAWGDPFSRSFRR